LVGGIVLGSEPIARVPAAMAFGPGCHDVRIGPTHDYRPVRRAGGSHVQPEHEVPTSAQNVCGTLKDKSSCRARFHDHFQRLIVLWFFAQRKCPIHFRKFPVSTALPQRFCKNCQTSVLFRLAPINFHLRIHSDTPRIACLRSTCGCTPMFRVLPCNSGTAGVNRGVHREPVASV
jgi:hypothetical protein